MLLCLQETLIKSILALTVHHPHCVQNLEMTDTGGQVTQKVIKAPQVLDIDWQSGLPEICSRSTSGSGAQVDH